ncbi:MAG TPA: AAA family ATPase [Actinospica sp.]|jgi:tetratricopeptide (TPR) repeat protein|nr:AAA family ATPase [Actinospica sp.]
MNGAREKAARAVGRELCAAWDRARQAGADRDELISLLRRRLALLRSTPTAYAPARTVGGDFVTTVKPPPIGFCYPQPHWVQDLAMAAAAFIGRAHELERLAFLLDEAYARRPGTVFLAGDPGVGKTRLLDEFTERALGGGDHVFVLRGECVDLSEEARIPYGPLVWALREFVTTHGAKKARELAGPGLDGLGGLIAEFLDDEPATAYAGSLTTAGSVYASVRRVLRILGDKRPVVLIFENVQWADQSTLDLVSFLTRSRRDERVLLICSHRGDLPPGHPLANRLAEPNLAQATESIALGPFSEDDLRKLLDISRDQARRIHELSEGNALFAKELQSADLTSLPLSLQNLMTRQIAGLSAPARKLLSVAATAARRVSYRLLGTVGNLTGDELENALRECLEQRILVPDRLNGGYVFRYALLRETVYANDIPEVRMDRHAAMAEAITENSALSLEEDASSAVELAHHWRRAGRPPEALVASLRAGAMTARLRAFPEAETHYRHALDLWKQVADPIALTGVTRERVLSEAADAARWAAHIPNAVADIKDAIGEVDEGAAPRRSGELHERLGSYMWEAGDGEGSAQAYADAHRLLALEGPADATDVLVLAGMAGAKIQAGQHTEALRLALEAAELAQSVGAEIERGRALSAAGVAYTMLGHTEEGVASLTESLEIARRAEQLEYLLRAYAHLGFALERAGELSKAADVALEGLGRARELGVDFARMAGLLANNAAFALVQLGKLDRAIELLETALLERPPVRESVYLLLSRAEIAVVRGDFETADRLFVDLADQRPTDPRFQGALRACQAERALWHKQPREALDTVSSGLKAVGNGENTAEELRLCSLGLRAAADLARSGAADDAVAEHVAELADRAERCAARDASPESAPLREQCAAERDRYAGSDAPDAWHGVAEAWEQLQRPYGAAYARWRQADALRAREQHAEAARVTREALESLETLHTEPLRTALATAADLPSVEPLAMPLTEQQVKVAILVAQGLGNAAIAEALHVKEGTVARHVHDAMDTLRKQGHPVKNRMGLANYAREHGLLGDGKGGGR